jgi:hypothetical protein
MILSVGRRDGIVALPLMVMLMIMLANSSIVAKFDLPPYVRTTGWAATAIMFLASLGFLFRRRSRSILSTPSRN